MSLSDYTIDLTNWWGKGRMSNCKIRQLHAAYLATFATYFIFEHELTHILHGHADYIQVNFNLTMSKLHSVSESRNVELQTMEMLADQGALYRLAYYMIDVHRNPHLYPHFHIHGNLYQSLLDIFFVAYNFFKLLKDFNDPAHPPPTIRQAILFQSAKRLIDKINLNYKFTLDSEKFSRDVVALLRESEETYTKLTGKTSDASKFREGYFFNHPMMWELTAYWNQVLYHKLQKYKFWTLPKDY